MWFGKEYFNYIPKERLKCFANCYENKELPDGSIKILLHENIWDYKIQENMERQWDFRRFTELDDIAQTLENKCPPSVKNENSDPTMEIENGLYEHGGNHRVKIYIDAKGENVIRSKASHCYIEEFGENKKIIWSGNIILKKN